MNQQKTKEAESANIWKDRLIDMLDMVAYINPEFADNEWKGLYYFECGVLGCTPRDEI